MCRFGENMHILKCGWCSFMHPWGHRQLGEVEWWPGIVEKNVGIMFFGGFLYDRSYSEFRTGNDSVVDTCSDKNHISSICKNWAGGVEPSGAEKKKNVWNAWRTIGDIILGVRIQRRVVVEGVVVYDCWKEEESCQKGRMVKFVPCLCRFRWPWGMDSVSKLVSYG